MMKISPFLLPLLALLLNITITGTSMAVPLNTNSRWIVDGGGRRVKLACVNWVSHLEVMVAEGLHKQPLEAISKRIAEMKFNCVRLTWALFMVTNSTLGSVTFRQSLQNHGLVDTIKGVEVNNPGLVDLPVIQVFQEVVSKLGDENVMVILDNHLSKPGWCCSNNDGNGFFGDQYFDPQLWTSGLAKMASMFSSSTNVVGMSLRNEPRGPRQNTGDWYRNSWCQDGSNKGLLEGPGVKDAKWRWRWDLHFPMYMKEGAESVHSANPNVLVIISGLSYASDLSFLSQKQLDLTFKGKLVYELHSYSWYRGSPDEACSKYVQDVMKGGGFLLDQGWPLFISEFGADERGTNANDNNFVNCFLGLAAERDLDWALWTLQGSYYLRQGVVGMEEFYGILDSSWGQLRNASFLQRLSAIQLPTQGPGISKGRPYKSFFHPATGLCFVVKSFNEPVKLGPCAQPEAWSYTQQKTAVLNGTNFCLQADALGKPAKLGVNCSDSNSKWEPTSESKMHLSSMLTDGTTVCLDIGYDHTVITNPCKCMKGGHRSCDPSSQWFKIIQHY